MQQSPESAGLEGVILRGALRRQHFYWQLAGAALSPALAAGLLAIAIYVTVMMLAGRTDWLNILVVALAAALIPVVAVSLLIISARRTYPFTMSLVVMVFAASFAVSVVSALRIPTSYFGLFLTLPTSLFCVTVANIAMVRQLRQRVGLLRFPGAEAVVAAAGWAMPIVEPDDIDVRFQRILIDPETHHAVEWTAHLAALYFRGIEIEAWPTYLESILGKVDLDSFDLAHVSYSPSQIFYYRAKRALDVMGVLVMAVPVLVLSGIIWAYIRMIDGGPSIFVQQRRGYGGSTFKLYKFRTMYKGEHIGSTTTDDSRIMPGCHILRQLRLDELPQLFNILKGDMSFIGPRPVAIPVAKAIEERIPLYVNRYILLPGLTGWAQVSQGYAASEDEEVEKLAFDLYYLKNVSLDLDIIIIFRTIRTVLLRFGAR